MMDSDVQIRITPAEVATAIRSGDLATVTAFYPSGCAHLDMVVGRRRVSAFNLAAIEGQLSIAQYLVGLGCDLNHMDEDHYNSAHLASWYGHAHILDYLASIRPQLFRSPQSHNLPIHIAAYRDHHSAIRSCAPYCDINKQNKDLLTSLRICIVRSHEEGVRACLEAGARLTAMDLHQKTSAAVQRVLWREHRWRNRKGYLWLLDKGVIQLNFVPLPAGLLKEVVPFL